MVKTTAFDLQLNPENPGLRFHKLDRTKDPNFWSVSANMDLRLIVHKTDASLLLCYVDHHDNAYAWATRRKIERHPKTGAAQLVEVRERIKEITIPQTVYKPVAAAIPATPAPLLFADLSEETLLSYGIPAEWIADVCQATEATLFDIAEHLPQEATEALLELATGGTPVLPTALPEETDPFTHPDAQRRFRVMTNVDELQRALDFPWEKWTVFLHPAQRQLVERDFNGPARVAGSAGTGKTIVALHRSVFLARCHPEARILLTTFSNALANALKPKLKRLVGNEPDIYSRIHIRSIRDIAYVLYTAQWGQPQIVTEGEMRSHLTQFAADAPQFSLSFLLSEWNDVADAWQLDTWAAYRDVPRLGRKTRLGGKQREQLWQIFEHVQSQLAEQQLLTWPGVFRKVTEHLENSDPKPFDFAVVDEAQDLGIAELRFLATLGKQRDDSLLFTGDLGQRIFQQPFSWKALGVDVRGRSRTLKINYRTSHQIRAAADQLLPSTIADVDGNTEDRRGTVSVFNGPKPQIEIFEDEQAEIEAVGEWICDRIQAGCQPDEIGVFVRSEAEIERAIAAIEQTSAKSAELNTDAEPEKGCIAVSTMHLAKGLEFRAVAVMACDDEVLPLQERIEHISDESDLEEVYNTERHLLYVACTRARDCLWTSGVDPASEFIDDLNL